jgi:putative sterol carrier protein
MSTPAEYFSNIAKNVGLDPEKAKSMNAVFKFELTGDDGGTWTVDLRKDNEGEVLITGEGPEPNVAITMTAADFSGIFNGSVNPMQAFMMGKIKVKGDMGLATKIQNLVQLGKD